MTSEAFTCPICGGEMERALVVELDAEFLEFEEEGELRTKLVQAPRRRDPSLVWKCEECGHRKAVEWRE